MSIHIPTIISIISCSLVSQHQRYLPSQSLQFSTKQTHTPTQTKTAPVAIFLTLRRHSRQEQPILLIHVHLGTNRGRDQAVCRGFKHFITDLRMSECSH